MKRFDKKFGKAFLAGLPTCPGVYRIYDESGKLIYVGKAKNLRRRLGQYRNAKRLKRHRKMKAIVAEAKEIRYDVYGSDLDACMEELKIIQADRPRWNVAGAFAFMYPMLGIKEEPKRTLFLFTTVPERFAGYAMHGAFRSRQITGDAFFALMKLLPYVAHKLSASEKADLERVEYSYVIGFRRLPEGWAEMWRKFFAGESADALETLVLRLVENAGARKKAAEVQENLKLLRRFWRHEVSPLRRALAETSYTGYPIAQKERDALFLRYRLK